MTKRDLAALTCKVLGIYSFLLALNSFSAAFQMIVGISGTLPSYPLKSTVTLVNLLPFGLHFTAALLLWGMSESLASLMVQEENSSLSVPVTHLDWQSLALSVLGAWGLLRAIPNLGRVLVDYTIVTHSSLTYPDAELLRTRTIWPNLFSIGLQIAISMWLLLGSRGLSLWLSSWRNVGRDSTLHEGERPSHQADDSSQ